MIYDPTRTASEHDGAVQKTVGLGLMIAHHATDKFLGSTCPLTPGESLVLGRGGGHFPPTALDDDRVSRRHTTVTLDKTQLRLQDLDSRNGTFLNGRRVESAALKLGDVIGIGKVLLLVSPIDPKHNHVGHPNLLGRSLALSRTLALIGRVAELDVTVLVLGESGVGKELIAKEIHAASGRSGKLVAVNCAAMSDGVISSELFGHVRGAFSSADAPRAGLVEEARAGTLLLDEIGDASSSLQASLLRLLQERETRPVGADQTVKVDIRFVAATNRPLAQDVRDGRFREDLYARLTRCVVPIPPLRERREDILPLARHFAEKVAGTGRPFHHRLASALLCHDWPGNVRSLQSTIERLVHDSGSPGPLSVPGWLDEEFSQHARHSAPASGIDDTTLPEVAVRPRARISARDLRRLLREHGGNITAVAGVLEVTRNTVYRWIKKFEINLDALRD